MGLRRVFYHGTYENNYERILKEGVIDNFAQPEETTKYLNSIINSYAANNEIRNNCVYLTDDNECTYFYDYAFTINESDLNRNLLYVADNSHLDNILSALSDGKKKLVNYYIRKYLKSFIEYEKFLVIEDEYRKFHKNIEFLYFGKIYIKNNKEVEY